MDAHHYLAGWLDSADSGGVVSQTKNQNQVKTRRPNEFVSVLRWMWAQLTSMRTALILLMLLALAAVPGAFFPQRPQDPAAVGQYLEEHATLGPWLDRLGFFDVYGSAWFGAVYVLLFTSLVGCILPRTRQHIQAIRKPAPRMVRNIERFQHHAHWQDPRAPRSVYQQLSQRLRGSKLFPRYRLRLEELPDDQGFDISAERGYFRETGNLLFHISLLVLLLAVGYGQMNHFRGQVIVVEGSGFANSRMNYDTFEAGPAFSSEDLEPFSITMHSLDSEFNDLGVPLWFRADLEVFPQDGESYHHELVLNEPLNLNGPKLYLQGNGYAVDLTYTDTDGQVLFSGPVTFLPEDDLYTSRGVWKIPNTGEREQIGFLGEFFPSALQGQDGTVVSAHPDLHNPVLFLQPFTGDLGLDEGIPRNVYQLDTSEMDPVLDTQGGPLRLEMQPGMNVQLPDDLGEVTFNEISRFAAFDIRHDPALGWILWSAIATIVGLSISLFTPRRRVWVKIRPAAGGGTDLSAAILARGEELGLDTELEHLRGNQKLQEEKSDA